MAQWQNNGFSLDGGRGSTHHEDANAILIDPLFKQAKHNDRKSADDLWTREWNRNPEENRRRLEQATAGAERVIFISVPGTSRQNQIPLAASQFLAKRVGSNAYFVNGDAHFCVLHTQMMKSIPRGERLFYPRAFEERDGTFAKMKRAFPNARYFVVEDLLTTGNSAHSFQRFLEKNGLPISGMIAMKGEYEPNVPPNLVKKIDKFFKQNDIKIDVEKLSHELTGKEAQTLAFQVSSQFKKADDEHKQLFRKLFETLYDIRVNSRFDLLQRMDQLSHDLSTYLRKEEQIKERKDEKGREEINSQVPVQKISISESLERNSAGRVARPDTGRETGIGGGTAKAGLRDDKANEGSAGSGLPEQKNGERRIEPSLLKKIGQNPGM